MANLSCVRHNKRVQVIDMGEDKNPIPLTVHRSNSKTNETCDSNMLVIDGEYYSPMDVLTFNDDEYNEKYIQSKHDALIYS